MTKKGECDCLISKVHQDKNIPYIKIDESKWVGSIDTTFLVPWELELNVQPSTNTLQ